MGMKAQYYKVMPIDVLPEESGYYFVKKPNGFDKSFYYSLEAKCWADLGATHWLKPITLTLQELLQTEEGKEIARGIFEKSRIISDIHPDNDIVWMCKNSDDFIKTNTHDSSK
jgi:hypothetical protein